MDSGSDAELPKRDQAATHMRLHGAERQGTVLGYLDVAQARVEREEENLSMRGRARLENSAKQGVTARLLDRARDVLDLRLGPRGIARAGRHLRGSLGLRAHLLGLDDDYNLRAARTPRGVHAPPSLVRFITFDGPQETDLRIDLQAYATLRRLPGGERLVQCLKDGIELVRIESRFAADRRKPLSAEQIEGGIGRLLEHRDDDAGDAPSLWG